MIKPEWKDAPEWAMWLAQDSNGDWCFFRECLAPGGFHWLPTSIPGSGDSFIYADEEKIGCGISNPDWFKTLEPRP